MRYVRVVVGGQLYVKQWLQFAVNHMMQFPWPVIYHHDQSYISFQSCQEMV